MLSPFRSGGSPLLRFVGLGILGGDGVATRWRRSKVSDLESLTASPCGLWVWEFAILFEFFFFF